MLVLHVLLFTEESVIETVDVNGTRELETLPGSFDGTFHCLYSQVLCYYRASTKCHYQMNKIDK